MEKADEEGTCFIPLNMIGNDLESVRVSICVPNLGVIFVHHWNDFW